MNQAPPKYTAGRNQVRPPGVDDIPWATAAFFLLFIPLLAFYLHQGLRIVGDGAYYLAKADDMLRRLDQGEAWSSLIHRYDVFYVVCIWALAVLKWLSGPHWQTAILVANAAFYSLCAPVVYLLYRMCGGRRRHLAWLGAGLLPLGYPEALFLGYLPLRDVPFTGMAAAGFLLIIGLSRSRLRAWRLPLALITCLALSLFRPNALVLIVAVAALYCWMRWSQGELSNKKAWLLLSIQTAAGLAMVFYAAYWFSDPGRVSWHRLAGLLLNLKEILQKGMVVIDHPQLQLAAPETYADFLKLLGLKIICYFRYWNSLQSPLHLMYRHVYFGVIFLNFVYFIWRSLGPGSGHQGETTRKLVFFTTSLALAGAFFHTLLVIAFEFRYQMILFPGLWALLLISAGQLSDKFIRR